MEMKLEVVTVPVSDADKAKEFYVEKLGFHEDIDTRLGEQRFIQLTPPGSACSIAMGEGITKVEPGNVEIMLVVEDIQATYEELRKRGLDLTEPKKMPWGAIHSEIYDPDHNHVTLQEKAKRD